MSVFRSQSNAFLAHGEQKLLGVLGSRSQGFIFVWELTQLTRSPGTLNTKPDLVQLLKELVWELLLGLKGDDDMARHVPVKGRRAWPSDMSVQWRRRRPTKVGACQYKPEHPGTNRINPTSVPRADLLAALEEQHVHLRLASILGAARICKMRLRRERQAQSAARCTKE